jgi:glutamyl-tRNA synthetase
MTKSMVRTRFAPSPTGYLHIGGARTALFSWAFARRFGGKFVLRIEDTDLERSTQQSVRAILDAMQWLALDYDEGPFHQMDRLDRYREVAESLVRDGKAYYCYASKEELDAMREAQRARGEKPRYDGRWRDSKATPPAGVKPVVRFKNPLEGEVVFSDLVKGHVSVQNAELDDLVLLRADGIPTYNFGVVVDDLDMNITHVIRGDDHVNNTPRQINIFRALDAPLPQFAHVPMILGPDGERLSKRHGAVSVMQYKEEGYLPEAILNYLARLGWAHGDEEIFSTEQFIEWFDLSHISRSAAKFNPEKLLWLNRHYLGESDPRKLALLVRPALLAQLGSAIPESPRLEDVLELLKGRVSLVSELPGAAIYFYQPTDPSRDLKARHFTPPIIEVLSELVRKFADIQWRRDQISTALKTVAASHGMKLGDIGVPLRVMVCGVTQTPPIDATLELIGKDEVIRRMKRHLTV